MKLKVGDLVEAFNEVYLAGYNAAQRWYYPSTDHFPKIGSIIIAYYLISSNPPRESWCAGVVDRDDEGLFIDVESDGIPFSSVTKWTYVPSPPKEEEK